MLLRCRAADSHLSFGWYPSLRQPRANPVVLAWRRGLKAFLDYGRVLLDAGLKFQLPPNCTAIEDEWAPVFKAIEACHQAVHAMSGPRTYTTVTEVETPEPIGTRSWRTRWRALRGCSNNCRKGANEKGAPCRAPFGRLQGLGSRCPGRGLLFINSSASLGCQYGQPITAVRASSANRALTTWGCRAPSPFFASQARA
jgi:hypothetical protein